MKKLKGMDMKGVNILAAIGLLLLILAMKTGGLMDNLDPNSLGPFSTVAAVAENLVPSIAIGLDRIVNQMTIAIYEVAKGLVHDSVPFGSVNLNGMIGTIVGYCELITLASCVILLIVSLLSVLKISVDVMENCLRNLFRKLFSQCKMQR